MALLEALKSTGLAQVAGNAGAMQDSQYVTWQALKQILFELFGAGQAAVALPAGFSGSTFPGGDTVTGTLPMLRVMDAVSLNSPAGATPNLKSFAVPAATPAVLGTAGVRGLLFEAGGTFANNASAKTITVAFGGSAAQTAVAATASTANAWRVWGGVYVRSATSVVLAGMGTQGSSTPSSGAFDLAVTGLTLTSAQTLQIAGTQTSAADIIQDYLTVWYLP